MWGQWRFHENCISHIIFVRQSTYYFGRQKLRSRNVLQKHGFNFCRQLIFWIYSLRFLIRNQLTRQVLIQVLARHITHHLIFVKCPFIDGIGRAILKWFLIVIRYKLHKLIWLLAIVLFNYLFCFITGSSLDFWGLSLWSGRSSWDLLWAGLETSLWDLFPWASEEHKCMRFCNVCSPQRIPVNKPLTNACTLLGLSPVLGKVWILSAPISPTLPFFWISWVCFALTPTAVSGAYHLSCF